MLRHKLRQLIRRLLLITYGIGRALVTDPLLLLDSVGCAVVSIVLLAARDSDIDITARTLAEDSSAIKLALRVTAVLVDLALGQYHDFLEVTVDTERRGMPTICKGDSA